MFAEIVKNLLVIIVVSSFLELLLPDGNTKPFIRFTIGLFVLIAVLSPTLAFFYNNKNAQVDLWNYQVDKDMEEKIKANGEKINQRIASSSNEQMKKKVAGQISAVTVLVPGVDDVHTEVSLTDNGSFQRVQLVIRPKREELESGIEKVNVFSHQVKTEAGDQKEIERKVVQVINNLYGVKADNIEIRFEGG